MFNGDVLNAPDVHSLEATIQATAGWILQQQMSTGAWADFQIRREISDEWVTAYVGWCLQDLPITVPEVNEALQRAALFLLQRQRTNGGWGYSAQMDADADSTALAVLCLQSQGCSAELDSARGFLAASQRADGGVSTYREELLPESLRFRMRGWCVSQPSVTASALLALGGNSEPEFAERATAFIIRAFVENCWQDYWWLEYYYPTGMCIRALQATRGDVTQADSVCKRLLHDQLPCGGWGRDGGSSFATSVAIRTLLALTGEVSPAVCKGAAWLMQSLTPVGAISVGADMLFPESYVVHFPDGNPLRLGELVEVIPDQHRLFTAATALDALGYLRRML